MILKGFPPPFSSVASYKPSNNGGAMDSKNPLTSPPTMLYILKIYIRLRWSLFKENMVPWTLFGDYNAREHIFYVCERSPFSRQNWGSADARAWKIIFLSGFYVLGHTLYSRESQTPKQSLVLSWAFNSTWLRKYLVMCRLQKGNELWPKKKWSIQ